MCVQVAMADAVYVFQVKHFEPGVRPGAPNRVVKRALEPLLPLFESKTLYKCGVGVDGDVQLLQKFAPEFMYQCVSLIHPPSADAMPSAGCLSPACCCKRTA